MKNINTTLSIVSLFIATYAFAGKSYQVTGPVLEVGKDSLTVQKGKEKWEVQTSPTTKGLGGVKVGDKVTVYYSMHADEIENKGAEKPAKKK